MAKPGDAEGASSYPQGEVNVAAGFWGSCLSFAVGATLTVTIVSLDLLTDWLLYRSLLQLHIPDLVHDMYRTSNGTSGEVAVRLQPFFSEVPLVFLVACSVAAFICGLYLIWFCYMFRVERNFLKDKYDGVTRKGCFCHKYGGEIFLFLHALLEDLLMSGLFFAVQVAVSCRFQLALGSVVYELAVATTLLSLGWKFGQLLWHLGCVGQREEYHSGLAVAALRCCTLLVLVLAFSMAVWNTILLVGWKYNDYRGPNTYNTIMDKIPVDRWKRADGIALLYIDSATPLSQAWLSGDINPTIVDIMSFDELLSYGNHSVYASRPCVSDAANFTAFMDTTHQTTTPANCSIVFEFVPLLAQGTILFDYMYSYTTDTGQCISGHLQGYQPQIPWQPDATSADNLVASTILTSLATTAASTVSMTTNTPSNAVTSGWNAVVSADYTSNVNTSMFHSLLVLSQLWTHPNYVCRYNLQHAELINSTQLCQA